MKFVPSKICNFPIREIHVFAAFPKNVSIAGLSGDAKAPEKAAMLTF
jgi:hypothetical protein